MMDICDHVIFFLYKLFPQIQNKTNFFLIVCNFGNFRGISLPIVWLSLRTFIYFIHEKYKKYVEFAFKIYFYILQINYKISCLIRNGQITKITYFGIFLILVFQF